MLPLLVLWVKNFLCLKCDLFLNHFKGTTRLTNHLRVGIIEPGKWKTELKENDSGSLLRVSALSPSTKNFLEVIWAWEDVSSPYYKMQVWDAQPYSSTGSVTFSSTNSQPIGYMMQNDVILNLLRQKIDQLQNLSVIASSVSGINYSDTNHQEVNNILSKDSIPSPPVIVTTSSGETIETKLLVHTNFIFCEFYFLIFSEIQLGCS